MDCVTYSFQADPFPCTIYVGVGDDFEKIAKKFKITDIGEHLLKAKAFYMTFNDGEIYLFFRPPSSSWVVAHEVSHACDIIFSYAGVVQPDTETRAYLLSNIIQKIYKKWPKNEKTK